MDSTAVPGSQANPKAAETLFTSRQRSAVSGDKSGLFVPTRAVISEISVAHVPRMQDLYPDMALKTYPNVFARTKIAFGGPVDDAASGADAAAAAASATAGGAGGSPKKARSALSMAKAISALTNNSDAADPVTGTIIAGDAAAAAAVTAAASTAAAAAVAAHSEPATAAAAAAEAASGSRIRYSQFIGDDEVVLLDIVRGAGAGPQRAGSQAAKGFVRAGPRAEIVYDAPTVRAAIVTCGSLCPGHNDVVEELFNCLYYNYGVDTVYGIRDGFRGFWERESQPWEALTPDSVRGISGRGGSILGTAKGGFQPERILNACEVYGVTQLYIVGGDGTHRAAAQLHRAAARRPALRLALCCIPNSLDNDVGVIDNSFGFETAVQVAARAIESVQVESMCAPNGIGIVQLMGKHAGYIAAHAVLAARDADLCLIPELAFRLYGRTGVLEYVRQLVRRQGYAVIVVAEGAGLPLRAGAAEAAAASAEALRGSDGADTAATAAGDGAVEAQTGDSVGELLKSAITSYFKSFQIESTIRCTYNNMLSLFLFGIWEMLFVFG